MGRGGCNGMMDSPCHYCDKRTPTCHGVCEDYKNFADERQKLNIRNTQARTKSSIYADYKINKMLNMKKGNYPRGKK
jgi:hypothetical protein